MRRTRGWTGLRPTVFALGLVAATAGGARADAMSSSSSALPTVPASPVLSFNTTVGSSLGAPASGSPLITFVPVTGSVMTPSNLSLGAFQVAAPASGTTTYNNTPFSIQLVSTAVNGDTGAAGIQTPIQVSGVLNGTVSSANQTNVVATFNPLASNQFTTGVYTNTLILPDSPLHLVPSTTNGGLTSIQAHLQSLTTVTLTAPEPTSVAVFVVALAGLAAHRRSRRRAA
jgi:hypothetical protein